MSKLIDLTGNKYGKLTVIKKVGSKYGQSYWLCRCECDNEFEISGNYLKKRGSINCKKCSINIWEFKDDYVVGYTSKGEKFLIDAEDYGKVSKYSWCINETGYVVTGKTGGGLIRLHRFVMKARKGEYVDHIYHEITDNRKSKLRLCSNAENTKNRKNVKGYTWDKKNRKYQAKIRLNGKTIHMGRFETEDEARLAYCTKALELFGEFAHEDVRKDYERLSKQLNNI